MFQRTEVETVSFYVVQVVYRVGELFLLDSSARTFRKVNFNIRYANK
jgi:hypothetical protein